MVKMKKLHKSSRIVTLIFALLFAFLMCGTYAGNMYESFINDRLQINTNKPGSADGKVFYKSDYATQDGLFDAKMELNREIVQEGTVLLKNENNALPLSVDTENKVSIFGRSSVNIVRGILGGASIVTGANDPLTEVFKSVGLNVNPMLYSFYENSTLPSYEYSRTVRIGEIPVADYTSEVKNSYKDYSDASFVVLSRSKGEGADFSLYPSRVTDGDGVHHGLGIHQNERDMIEEAKTCSKKVIVLIASDYAMEIDDLKRDPDIDAILWIGGTGLNGIYGVADIIVGNVSPSGHLADTYAADIALSPAAQGWGGYKYTNADSAGLDDLQDAFTVYQEGIYVGYKYYETRYEDCVYNINNAASSVGARSGKNTWNYSDEVSYSFGYGLSYSDFTEQIIDSEFNGTTVTFKIKVTNTGSMPAKHSVQIYAQSPYTLYDEQNDVEKAAVQLVGFAKTGEIAANGGSEEVTVKVDLHDLASYDRNGHKTYIMEAGTYYFACGNGAHDALNNILAKKGKTVTDGMDYDGNTGVVCECVLAEDDFTTYSKSLNNTDIHNQLENADINYYGNFVTYLSRKDWSGTWPKDLSNVAATDAMIKDLANGSTYTATIATEADKAAMKYDSKETNYSILDMRGLDFDDPKWEDFISQLSLSEMSRLVGASGSGAIRCPNISFLGSVQRDGPAGPKANYTEGKHDKESAVTYPSEVVIASTFNTEISEKVGKMMGNDALWLNTTAIYGPGDNIHRTPMSGRNSEYFSEDSVLAGEMAYYEVGGAYEYGLIMGSKHFAFNDQESHRNGICTFFNEQGGREIMLRAFEKPLRIGLAAMSAYNRVGCIYSSAHIGLMSGILRGEWDYKGILISDAVGSFSLCKYADGPASVTAGLSTFAVNIEDLYCGSNGSINEKAIINDPVLFKAMRRANHYNLYVWANSSAVNNYSDNMNVGSAATPWWKAVLITADVVAGAVLALGIAGYVVSIVKDKEKDNERV